MELILGFILGILASFIVWYLVAHSIVPSLEFFPVVYVDTTEGKPQYRIRYCNTGKRKLIDLEIVVKLRIRGLNSSLPQKWRAAYIPIDDTRIPLVPPLSKKKSRAVRLMTSQIEEKYSTFIPISSDDSYYLLEDLLELGNKAHLEVYAFCYDAFSGSRKLFTHTYYKDDLVPDPRN